MRSVKKTIIQVDYNDLDEAIKKYLNLSIPFESVAYQEWNNDSQYEFHIDGRVDDYNRDQIAKGKYMYGIGTILNMMCADGLIEVGNYMIDVNW